MGQSEACRTLCNRVCSVLTELDIDSDVIDISEGVGIDCTPPNYQRFLMSVDNTGKVIRAWRIYRRKPKELELPYKKWSRDISPDMHLRFFVGVLSKIAPTFTVELHFESVTQEQIQKLITDSMKAFDFLVEYIKSSSSTDS